jgi:hypothetical protein
MGLGEVTAALKAPVITPGGMLEWQRAAAAPRRRPTMNKSPRKICPAAVFLKSTLKDYLESQLKNLKRVHRHKTGDRGFFRCRWSQLLILFGEKKLAAK